MKKISFIQGWGTYTNQTFVCVGMTFQEVIRQNKRLHADKWFTDFITERKATFEGELRAMPKGFLMYHESGASLLWLKTWKDDWEHYETLIHELHHAVHFMLGKLRLMNDEAEALAYQQEWMFRQLRRRLRHELKLRTKKPRKKKRLDPSSAHRKSSRSR